MIGLASVLASVLAGPPGDVPSARSPPDAETRPESAPTEAPQAESPAGEAPKTASPAAEAPETGTPETGTPETGAPGRLPSRDADLDAETTATSARATAVGPEANDAARSESSPSSEDSSSTSESAQPGELAVRVLVRGRRDAVAGARLLLRDPSPGLPASAETDAFGELSLTLPAGEYRFELRADGYRSRSLVFEVVAGERRRFELRLDEDLGGNRFRTEVASDRPVAVSATRLRDAEIHELPGSAGDPFSAIRSLPGAAQVTGFLPYVVVRGAAPGNTGYYLDGVRVPALFHVAAGPSVIHPYFIDEVDFYAGGVPVRLGRFASGIVEGKTRKGGRDRVRGEVDLRLTDAGALLEIPLGRSRDRACLDAARQTHDPKAGPRSSRRSLRGDRRSALARCRGPGRGALTLAGRYSYTGLLLSAIPALNLRLRFWDYQARLDYDLSSRLRYTAFVFGSFDEIGQAEAIIEETDDAGVTSQRIDRNPDPFLGYEFHRIDQRLRQRLGPRGQIDYKLALGLDRAGVQDLGVDQWRVAPRIDARFDLSEQLSLHAGLDQEFQIFRLPGGLDSDQLSTSIEDLALALSERFVSVTGLYVDLAFRKGGLEVRPGIRGDLWLQVGPSPFLPQARAVQAAVGVDPRVLLRERVHPRWTLRQSFGVYHQPPDPPIPIPGIESIGFERGLQRNIQGSFGWEWEIGDRAVLTQDLFLGRLTNMQDYELSQGLGDTMADEFDDYLLQVSGWSWGLETMLRLIPDGRAYGWLAYTLSWSVRDYPLGGFAPATWDQRHILNAVAGWNINSKWRLGGRLHFNSGRPYTARRSDGEGNLETLAEAFATRRNGARLPAFIQLDVRVERVFTLDSLRLHLYLDLANATFAREVLRCDSVAELNDTALQVQNGCVNPQALRYVLPALGLRAVF